MNAYYQHVLILTGLTGILAAIPCILLYRGDLTRRRETGILYLGGVRWQKTGTEQTVGNTADNGKFVRKGATGYGISFVEILGFLVIGAFLGQYGNILVGLFQQYLNPEIYQETQALISQGKSIWLVFLRMRDHLRIITAAALSGLAFGIYHMNLIQGVYAAILGTLFALLLEWKGNLFTSVLLHIGANVWSLMVSDVMLYLLDHVGAGAVMLLNLVLVFAGTFGIWKCYKDYKKRGCTRLI